MTDRIKIRLFIRIGIIDKQIYYQVPPCCLISPRIFKQLEGTDTKSIVNLFIYILPFLYLQRLL